MEPLLRAYLQTSVPHVQARVFISHQRASPSHYVLEVMTASQERVLGLQIHVKNAHILECVSRCMLRARSCSAQQRLLADPFASSTLILDIVDMHAMPKLDLWDRFAHQYMLRWLD
jgi:hypothetical protein